MRTLNGVSLNRGHIITYTKTWLKSVARLGRAIRVSPGSSDITAACDDDGDTVKSVNLFFISPTAFRARAMLTLPVWLRPGSLLLTTLSPDVVSGALHFSLMISTAPRYCSTYVFFVLKLNIFKISMQNCRFSFTRYTVLQSHARPISVSHRYRQPVQCILLQAQAALVDKRLM